MTLSRSKETFISQYVVNECNIMCRRPGSSRLQYRPPLRGGALHRLHLPLLQTLYRLANKHLKISHFNVLSAKHMTYLLRQINCC